MDVIVSPSALGGIVNIPPSKSAAHRAIIAAAIADGKSVIKNVDLSNDIRASMNACISLGCNFETEQSGSRCILHIQGGFERGKKADIDCCESGSTLRFFIPIACALGGEKKFTGEGRLPRRPIDAYLDIFDAQGIAYTRPADSYLPLKVSGTLEGGFFDIDGRISSQYITGLLFALPLMNKDSMINVTGGFESRGYVDLTVDMLRKFGVQISADENSFFVGAPQAYAPQDITVEGDYSQAAFFLVGGAVTGEARLSGLLEPSLQPDSVITALLLKMGADIRREGSVLIAKKSKLYGTDIDVSQCPDLVPPLAVAAAYAQGKTRITGAARLRIKESDRLSALAQNLGRLGIKTQETHDALEITGGPVAGGEVSSFGDHRIAMAFSIAALGARGSIRISGAESTEKSYPAFYDDLKILGGKIE